MFFFFIFGNGFFYSIIEFEQDVQPVTKGFQGRYGDARCGDSF